MSQSFTSINARTQLDKDVPIRLSVNHAEEVIDALQWVVDDWKNMDAAEQATHQGYFDTYHSILSQLKGEPSY